MNINDNIGIEEFYPELILDEKVQKELINVLGRKKASLVIKQFAENISWKDIDVDFEDIVADVIDNESEEVNVLIGNGCYGEFPIHIMKFGPLFWVNAQEFDPIGYFKEKESAESCAEFEYQSFL